jgi:hypothetical protein
MISRRYRFIALAGLLIVAAGAALATVGYPQLAVYSAPRKAAKLSDSPQATGAKQAFMAAFMAQRYEALPEVTAALTAAYLKNPNDPKLALLLGHAHFWRAAERGRDPQAGPGITDSLVLANFYFSEAYRLQPDDHRIAGWLASTQMALGSVHGDERAIRRGYFMLKESARADPEFNDFTLGYVMSRLPAGDPKLAEAVQAMWANLDLCAGHKVDRRNPDLSVLGSGGIPEGPRRVCFNGPYTPHNVEGFFLAFGDLLVKTGDPERAKAVYLQARVSPAYESWPFKALLEERVKTADIRAAQFASLKDAANAPEMIGASSRACAVCHAQ